MATEIEFGKLASYVRKYCEAFSLPDQSADVVQFVRVDMRLRPDQYAIHRLSMMHVIAERRVLELVRVYDGAR